MPAPTRRATPWLAGLAFIVAAYLVGTAGTQAVADPNHAQGRSSMQLGQFSLSLAVKDLEASRTFYATLGFEPVGGNPEHGWLILRNDTVVLGLFQDKFEGNILTFNPGWDVDQNTLKDFEDVREIQARLKAAGIELLMETDPEGDGIGHIVLQDPDGNQIMFDQHVPKPKR